MHATTRTLWLTAAAMLAFAANSLLCRLALQHASIDPASFGSLRLGSGALVLAALLRLRSGTPVAQEQTRGDWLAATMLSVSYTHLTLPTKRIV